MQQTEQASEKRAREAKPSRLGTDAEAADDAYLVAEAKVPRKRSLMQPEGPRNLGSKLRQRLCLQLKLNSPQLERSGSQQKQSCS